MVRHSHTISIFGPYRRMTWWDVAPWVIGVALAFFLFGFHLGINTQSRIQNEALSAARIERR